MEADSNWAPPTIGDIRLPDRDLGRRLAREHRIDIRAKMLGMDWITLRAARRRLLAGAWLISTAAAVLVFASDLGRSTDASIGPWLASVLIVAAVFAPMVSLRSVSRLPVQIARNDPSTAERYRALAKLSPTRSLLGYRVRWILLRYTATTVSAVAVLALVLRSR